jgi:hypothetical protein
VRSDIKVFVEQQRGPDPSNPDQLCSQSVLIVGHRCFGEFSPFLDGLHHCSLSNLHFCCFCQNKYGEVMVRLHGEGVNWRQQEIDTMALYTSGGRKRHGW